MSTTGRPAARLSAAYLVLPSSVNTELESPRIDALFGTLKSLPVYPGYFADAPTAVTYFTGFYAWYNDLHPLTTLAMLTPNQVDTGQRAKILTARQVRQAQALDHGRSEGLGAPLLANILPAETCGHGY